MSGRLLAITVLGMSLLSGCAHTQLRWNTTHQAKTLTDIYEQQVMDNLAMFVHDPNSLPSFAYPDKGGSDVTDNGSVGNDLKWGRPASALKDFLFLENALKLGASRNMKEGWTLQPVYDVRRLELMRCAYQQALACAGLCTMSDGCPNCDKLQRAFYLGDPQGKYDKDDPVLNHLAHWTMKTGRTTPACFSSCQWLCCGSHDDIPKSCCDKVGHYCGKYVWLADKGQNELSKLTMVILDYAFSAQAQAPKRTKDVTMYFTKDGVLTDANATKAIEIKTTVPYETPVPLATIEQLNVTPFDSSENIPNWNMIDSDLKERIDAALKQPNVSLGMEDENQLNPEQLDAIKKQMRARDERLNTLRDLIGSPATESELPVIQSPASGFSPLQFELYRQTLTSPSP